jgi:plastocyanin
LLALSILYTLATALASAEATVEGRVDLPKTRHAPVVNKRYSMTAKGGNVVAIPAGAIVYLSGSFPRPAVAPRAELAQEDLAFVPNLLPIQVGTRVEFPNRDHVDHSIYSSSPAKSFNIGRFGATERPVPSEVFEAPGLVTIRCDIHENMRAEILVLDTPYFAVTDSEGRFHLGKLPAGHFELKAWLDRRTTLSQPVDLRDGAVATVNFPR